MRKIATERHKSRLEQIKISLVLVCLCIIKVLILAKLIYNFNAINKNTKKPFFPLKLDKLIIKVHI